MLSHRSRLLISLPALLVLAAVLFVLPSLHSETASANPLGGFVSINGGEGHTCARMIAGSVKCWGENIAGQLGNAGGNSAIPVNANTSPSVLQMDAGPTTNCAVETGGGMECWGFPYGSTPTTQPGLVSGVASVSVGGTHQCAVTTGGGVKCWGTDAYGELGDGPVYGGGVPVDVTGLTSGVSSVSAGLLYHTCAVTTGGGVKCWGDNSVGQLGAASFENCSGHSCSTAPVDVTGLATGVTAVSLGREYSCALTSSGAVKCWGLGFGVVPITVAGLSSGVAQISAGGFHLCARMTSGGIKCRGQNTFGQLGDGTTTLQNTPVNVAGLGGTATGVSAGYYHTCAVLSSGTAKCWGLNFVGQLGNAVANPGANPVPRDVVVSQPKPTPTPTPCPPGGCPTATPTPTVAPTSGLDFSIGIDTNGDTTNDCGTRPQETPKCVIAPGAPFQVRLFLNSLPVGVPVYAGLDAIFHYQAVSSQNLVQFDWPECALVGGPFFSPGLIAVGCGIGIGAPYSSYTGPMLRVSMTCTASGSVSLIHGAASATDLVDPNLISYAEGQNVEEALAINCVNPPTPQPVGGVAFDPPSRGEGASIVSLILAASVMLVALGGASLRARRALRR